MLKCRPPSEHTRLNHLVFLSGILLVTLAGCTQRPMTWNERTAEYDQAFLVDGRTDRRIIFRDVGNPNGKMTLLFVHGLLGSKVQWVFVAPEFRDDYRIVMVDLLGHGGSSKPDDCDYSMSMQAGILRKLILELDLSDLVLVGASYGGGTALELAHDLCISSDRDRLRGVVLLGPAGLHFKPSGAHAFVRSSLWRNLIAALISGPALAQLTLESCYHNDKAIADELLLDHSVRLSDAHARHIGGIAGAQIFTELDARGDAEYRYQDITCPVLIVWGAQDEIVPRKVFTNLHELLPNSTTAEINDCGHAPMFERPGATAAHIRRFVQELQAAP
ncbi:MAG: alpha/beta hydrolase [Phycisphaerae bacterium]|nr:alpha/beta hydrolase [Phycisphaerae bacterium]